jgi:hypothetical protein
MVIIPVQLHPEITPAEITPGEVEELTLKKLEISESLLEEFVRKNVQVLFPDETLLIVGQQPKNKAGGRADLVAVDGEGSIVLIELKRDVEDIIARKEPFEFQAIRYAANYALIATPQDLVQRLFAPYIEKHKQEFELGSLTSSELASRTLVNFLRDNNAENSFNLRQRIMLIASAFDPQTLSACAWLAKNGIAIVCLVLSPLRYNEQLFFEVEQVIPPPALSQYFVELAEQSEGGKPTSSSASKQRNTNLPRMAKLFEWGLVKAGDEIYIKGRSKEIATMLDQQNVQLEDQTRMSYFAWGKKVTGWASINIYEWITHKPTNKTLDALRQEKMREIEEQSVESAVGTDNV